MPAESRLTNSSEETEMNQLLSGDVVFSIPYFQRAYKWNLDKLGQLQNNLLQIIDADDSHFLGAIIMYARRPAVTSDPMVYDVIDGQQRITTVFVSICAFVRTLCRHQRYEEAIGAFLKYLVVNRDVRLVSNARLHCGKEDRAQLNAIFQDLLGDEAFSSALGAFKFKPLPAGTEKTGRLYNNYRAALRFLENQVQLEGLERLEALFAALLDSMTVVQIVVRNPTDGPKIFDSLNSRQEPMTTGDLVRNEIFSRVADRSPEEIEAIDLVAWQPFYGRFKEESTSLFDEYFFPFGLILDPNIRKSEVYERLRKQWRNIDEPQEIIASLAEYQSAFLDAVRGTNNQGHTAKVRDAFKRLNLAKAPSSTYSFLMQLSNAAKNGDINENQTVGVVDLVESFLVRRAICGHEPTGLHAVFKRLWLDCEANPTRAGVEAAIRRHRTVIWPTDNEVTKAILERPLYGSAITPYVLLEWNRQAGGDQPNLQPWIEHVLPEKPVDEWFQIFSKEQHSQLKDTLGNLIPLSQAMNQTLSNKLYAQKKDAYHVDSGFKSTREFGVAYQDWTPMTLSARAEDLAKWTVARWPSVD